MGILNSYNPARLKFNQVLNLALSKCNYLPLNGRVCVCMCERARVQLTLTFKAFVECMHRTYKKKGFAVGHV